MLEKVDLSADISRKDYEKQILEIQLGLVELQQKIRVKGIPVIIMYEGWDASGKGGSILRITEKIDPRGCRVWPIAAPTPEELSHHYLWRFWTRMPGKGEIAIFDRSWYGRVLVERVEKLAKPHEWKRAYGEIRDFERSIVDNGAVLIKFWMQISKDEQLKRFKQRENDPFKNWKLCPDDWRNRDKWDEYVDAAEEMFTETNLPHSPWHLISAECKMLARIQTAKTVEERLRSALKD
jgi:polyphosphate kinase 2 (PPK2 family)